MCLSIEEQRVLAYGQLLGRLRCMRTSEERGLLLNHEIELLARIGVLADAVAHDWMGLTEARLRLDQYITSLKDPADVPDTGNIKF